MSTFDALLNEFHEARLDAVCWQHGGRDLELSLILTSGERVRIRCRAVSGLDIDLEWRRNTGGMARASVAEVEMATGGRWSLHWSLLPSGRIRLECADLQVLREAVAEPGCQSG